jgi:tRNA G46 methylase TrmB
MADKNQKKAYIGMEREENSLKYIAKVIDEPPCQITKAQYNAIVKALRAQDWANSVEDEETIISGIISRSLQPSESNET